jgi:hypothetical protein
MGKYDGFFNQEAFDIDRPIKEYEEVKPEIEDDSCTCDFDGDNCPIHGEIKLDEEIEIS